MPPDFPAIVQSGLLSAGRVLRRCAATRAPPLIRSESEAAGKRRCPEPYHSLLVHQSDMTSTLEKFHKEKFTFEVRRPPHQWKRNIVAKSCCAWTKAANVSNLAPSKSCWTYFRSRHARRFCANASRSGRILTDFGVPFPAVRARICAWPRTNSSTARLHLKGAAVPLWPPQHPARRLGTAPGRNRRNTPSLELNMNRSNPTTTPSSSAAVLPVPPPPPFLPNTAIACSSWSGKNFRATTSANHCCPSPFSRCNGWV